MVAARQGLPCTSRSLSSTRDAPAKCGYHLGRSFAVLLVPATLAAEAARRAVQLYGFERERDRSRTRSAEERRRASDDRGYGRHGPFGYIDAAGNPFEAIEMLLRGRRRARTSCRSPLERGWPRPGTRRSRRGIRADERVAAHRAVPSEPRVRRGQQERSTDSRRPLTRVRPAKGWVDYDGAKGFVYPVP